MSDKYNQDMFAFYQASSDFRQLLVLDPVLRSCFDAGLNPLQTIIALSDRSREMRDRLVEIYENGIPPIIIERSNLNKKEKQ